MLLKEKLDQDIFSFSERIIINYLIGNIDNIETLTTSSIAAATHTNTTSLIRIAKKLNLIGWKDLKNELIHERDYLNSNLEVQDANKPFQAKDSSRTIANKIGIVMKESIDDTLSLIDYDEIKYICRLLSNSKKIMIFSGKNNLNAINVFVSYLRRIQYDVQVADTFDYPEFEAYNLSQHTVALFISYSGENPEILRFFKFAKEQGVKTISITNVGENTLSKESTYHLCMSTHEKLYSKIGSFNSTTSLNFLLNVIYSILFAMDYDYNFHYLQSMNKALERRHSDTDLLQES